MHRSGGPSESALTRRKRPHNVSRTAAGCNYQWDIAQHMYIIVTISSRQYIALIINIISGDIERIPVAPEFIDNSISGRAPCRPFGITWTRSELFIANNRQVLAFDHDLKYKFKVSDALQVNTHQLAFHDGRIWAVSPSTNSLIGLSYPARGCDVELDLLDDISRPYAVQAATIEDDIAHFNSILWTSDRLYVAAHAFGPNSFISSYDPETLELRSISRNVGNSIHGLALHEDQLYWLSSGSSEIRSSTGMVTRLERKGYARGFGVTNQYFIVAISEFLARKDRISGDSWINIIDRKTLNVVKEIFIEETGSINDLRILDEYDFAHHLPPFWAYS